MASGPDDDFFQSERFIKRRYLQIPKDQQKLLDDNGAWSQNLKKGQHGMFNVPSQILQEAKEAAISKLAEPTQEERTPSPMPIVAGHVDSASKSTGQEHAASSPVNNNDDDDDDDDDESDGQPLCSWPETQPSVVDVAVTQEPSCEAEAQRPSPEKRHASPLRSTQLKRKHDLSFVAEDPASSAVNSDSLDIELRDFLSQPMESPVNRAALRAVATGSGRPEPTPPSAQAPPRSPKRAIQPPPIKRRRMLEEIQSSGNDPEASQPAGASSARAELSSKEPENNQNSMATSISTDLYSPRRTHQRPIRTDSPRVRSDPAITTATHQERSSFTPTWEGRQRTSATYAEVNTRTSASEPLFAPSLAQHTAEHRVSSPPATTQSRVPAKEGRPVRTPYEEFKAAYADYSENSRKFVSACLSVNQLRRDRQLPEFLYDDYVRAHSSEYLVYVSECDRKKSERILPAIQWYNETTKDMQYTKRLIRKDNLAAILEAHAGEARSVRRSLGDSQSTTSESAAEEGYEDMEDAPEGDEDEEEEQEPETIEVEMGDASESPSSPQLHIESPGPVPVQVFPEPARDETASPHNEDLSRSRSLSTDARTTSQRAGMMEDDPQIEEVSSERGPLVGASEPERIPSTPHGGGSMKKGDRTPASHRSYASQSTAQRLRGSTDSIEFLRPISSTPPVHSGAARSSLPHNERVPETPTTSRCEKGPASSARVRHRHPSVGVEDAAKESSNERAVQRTWSPPQQRAVRESPSHRSRTGRDDSDRDDDDGEGDDDDDESEEDAFETAPQELMPPPLIEKTPRNLPASRVRSSSSAARAECTSTAPPAVGHNRARPSLTATSPAVVRASNTFSSGRRHSPTSSDIPYANTSRSFRRTGESTGDRSRSLKEFLLKRRTAGTPSSTLASRK